MAKKSYTFGFDISGSCRVTIEAENEKEAAKLLLSGDHGVEFELDEWNVDYPYNFREYCLEDVLSYCYDRDSRKAKK